jgi:hypothetical protein
MSNLLLIIWWTLIGFVAGTFGSIIAGALLQTFGVTFWVTDFMVSPGSIVVGIIAACGLPQRDRRSGRLQHMAESEGKPKTVN